jgi:transcription termination factor NusB
MGNLNSASKFFSNHLSRILAVQYIYHSLLVKSNLADSVIPFEVESIIHELKSEEVINKNSKPYNIKLYTDLVENYINIKEEVDQYVGEIAKERPISEIDLLTRSIWYCIVTEVELLKNIPPKVGIDEAIELDKELNAGHMYSLTNAVLGKYFKL